MKLASRGAHLSLPCALMTGSVKGQIKAFLASYFKMFCGLLVFVVVVVPKSQNTVLGFLVLLCLALLYFVSNLVIPTLHLILNVLQRLNSSVSI